MNPNNDRPSFLDRGTIIAFAVILVFWLGWTKFMEVRYPAPVASPAANVANTEKTQAPNAANPATPSSNSNVAPTSGAQAALSGAGANAAPEQVLHFSNDTWAFDLSSRGMGVRDIDLHQYKTREEKPIVLSEAKDFDSFATILNVSNQPVAFAVERVGDNQFVGRADVGGAHIEKTIVVNSSKYTLETTVKVTSAPAGFKGLTTTFGDIYHDNKGGGMFSSSRYEYQSWSVEHDGEVTRQMLTHKEKPIEVHHGNAIVAALSAHYFSIAIVDQSPLSPTFDSRFTDQSTAAEGRLTYSPVSAGDSFNLKYIAFAGPKSFDLLSSIDENLVHVIDYGFFAVIARPILKLLKLIHEVVPNWGWAIILLTIIVRLIVLPFNVYSYRSMKVMQKLQPEMNRVREKYKDGTPEQKLQMNAEIMQLMKTNKANPMGGCLPMLLQLPVFLALYQVLGQSIELYRAPFILWIMDLSARDPYFVLPVLMGAVMFVNQKMTPSTMDPQQAKILMWMPVLFSVFMVSLPSGLTLYIFVSTLFGVIQQYVFVREKPTAQTVNAAKA